MTLTSSSKRFRVLARLVMAVAAACLAPRAWSAKPDCAAARKTYATTCSMCHKPDGTGYASIKTADFTDQHWQATHTDSQLITAISNGVKGTVMLSFKNQLTSQQINDLLHCVIRRFGKQPTAKPALPNHPSASSGKDSNQRNNLSFFLPAEKSYGQNSHRQESELAGR